MFFADSLFFRQESATQKRLHSQHSKNVWSHMQRPQFFWVICAGQIRSPVPCRPHLREGLTLAPPVNEIGWGHGIAALVQNHNQPSIILIWKRSQQHSIDYAENRSVRPNPERQRDDRHSGESRVLPQGADCIAQIMKQGFHDSLTRNAAPPWDRPSPPGARECSWQGATREPGPLTPRQR